MKTIKILQIALCMALLLFVTVSCQDNDKVQPESTRNGGARTPPATLEEVEELSFDTEEEAEDYVNNQLSLFSNLTTDTDVESESGSYISCLIQGTYYVDRATYGLSSDVNIRYERDAAGNIQNVTTSVTGVPLYTWNQQGVTVFNKYEFCIDAVVTFGIDIDSVPTSWSKNVRIRVWLNSTPAGCKAQTQFKYGNCSQ